MPYQIEWVWKAPQPNPFNVLLVGDGFTYAEMSVFDTVAKKLAEHLFRVPPFDLCKPYISVLKCFVPSARSGIPDEAHKDDPPPTIFRTYIAADKYITPVIVERQVRPGVTVNEAAAVQVIGGLELPVDFEPPVGIPRTPIGVWFNPAVPRHKPDASGRCLVRSDIPDERGDCAYHPGSKSHGAVAIIANSPSGLGTHHPEIHLKDGEISGWSLFALSLQGHLPTDGVLSNSYLNTFIHELAHCFGLGDEYEKYPGTLDALAKPEIAQVFNKLYKNISYSKLAQNFVENSPDQYLAAIPWKNLMTKDEIDGVLNRNHIFFKADLEQAGFIPNQNAPVRQSYWLEPLPGLGVKQSWDQAFIVEGGGQSARFIYRSNFECRMRHDQFDDRTPDSPSPIVRDGMTFYQAPDFCRVCNYQIRRHVTGWDQYGFGCERLRLDQLFYEEVMPRVKRSFELQNAATGSEYATDKPFCDIASARAFIVLRQCGLDVRFAINPFHVCLYVSGVYLDPTFYDFYRISGEVGPLQYRSVDGSESMFEPGITTRGLAGVIEELEGTFAIYIPRNGSYIQRHTYLLPAFTQDMVADVFASAILWRGPDRDPEIKDKGLEAAEGKVRAYVDTIGQQWGQWQAYLGSEAPAFWRPLRLICSSR